MKRNFTLGLMAMFVGILLLPIPFAAASEPLDPVQDMWVKGGRGICNMAFGWAEIFFQPAAMAEDGHRWPIAAAGGGIRGIFKAVERTLIGAYETLTFAVPNPSGDFEPLIKPDFVIPKG